MGCRSTRRARIHSDRDEQFAAQILRGFGSGFGPFRPLASAAMKVDGQNPECGICQLNRSMSEAGEIIWENKHW